MNNRQQQILAQLQRLGLANRDMTDETIATKNDDDTPWFLQLFFGFSGFIASLFFIGFLSLLFEMLGILDSLSATFIIGLMLSGISLMLFRRKHTQRSAFLTSLTFAISVAGQLYITFALFDSTIGNPLDVWLFLLIQIIFIVIMPNFIYRFLSTGIALSCIIYLLAYYQATEAGLALLALITLITNLQRYPMLQGISTKWRLDAFELSKAVGYASAIMLLIFSTFLGAGDYGKGLAYYAFGGHEAFIYNYILAQVLLVLVSLYAMSLILQRYQVKLLTPTSLVSACAIVMIGALSIFVSGLLATSLVIVIAMANSQRVLLALGIAALVGYIFWYYYQLDTSLLIKSISMLIIGIAILLMRGLLVIFYPANSKTPVTIATVNNKERLL